MCFHCNPALPDFPRNHILKLCVSVQVFAHNDVEHLEAVLRRAIAEGQPRIHRPWKKILIVVEGIYSMEGEMANLAGIVALKKKYKARLCSPCTADRACWTHSNLILEGTINI